MTEPTPITLNALRSEYERGALDTQTRILDALRDDFLSKSNDGTYDCVCGACCESMGCEFEDLIPDVFGKVWNPNPRPRRAYTGPLKVDMSSLTRLEDDKNHLADFAAKLGPKRRAGENVIDWMKRRADPPKP